MKELIKPNRWLLKNTVKQQVNHLLGEGYQEITEKDMWEFLECFYWKKNCPQTLKEMKVSIKKINANDYFDYQRLKAMTKNDFDDLDLLL